jgi:hypothetical protein
MKDDICLICHENCIVIDNDKQMNLAIIGNIHATIMPCCGQNGTEPPAIHFACFNKLMLTAEKRKQPIYCPLCRINLIPFFEGERKFIELKK